MKLTKMQIGFLRNLKTLNARGVTPNVTQVAYTVKDNLSRGQILHMYRTYRQLAYLGLVLDHGSNWTHKLEITTKGIQALEEVK